MCVCVSHLLYQPVVLVQERGVPWHFLPEGGQLEHRLAPPDPLLRCIALLERCCSVLPSSWISCPCWILSVSKCRPSAIKLIWITWIAAWCVLCIVDALKMSTVFTLSSLWISTSHFLRLSHFSPQRFWLFLLNRYRNLLRSPAPSSLTPFSLPPSPSSSFFSSLSPSSSFSPCPLPLPFSCRYEIHCLGLRSSCWGGDIIHQQS